MLWLHGGGHTSGWSHAYDGGPSAASRGVIVATVNYRLGDLGFAGSDELRSRDPSNSTGNYGLLDQRAAMIWLRENAAAFGGSPDNLMIYGQSAGGGSVTQHLVMPNSFAHYNKAVVHSNTPASRVDRSMQTAEAQFQALKAETDCADVECLLGVSGAEIIRKGSSGVVSAAPTRDGVELGAPSWELLESGQFNKAASVMQGIVKDEGTLLAAFEPTWRRGLGMTEDDLERFLAKLVPSELLDRAKEVYAVGADEDFTLPYWAATHASGDFDYNCPLRKASRAFARFSEQPHFAYHFQHTPRVPTGFGGLPLQPGTAGCAHSSEIPFLFMSRESLEGADEVELSEQMATYWTNFAKFGDPSNGLHVEVEWTAFTQQSEELLALDVASKREMIAMNRFSERCGVIDELPTSSQTLSSTEAPTSAPTEALDPRRPPATSPTSPLNQSTSASTKLEIRKSLIMPCFLQQIVVVMLLLSLQYTQ